MYMSDAFPQPGKGYVIRERLGGGFWKQAYRATSTRSTADVALLYPHDDSRSDILLKDVSNLIRAARGHPFSGYLAQFHGFEHGDDGRLFIVEELLERPLDRMHPLHDLGLFVRISRDLCRGLCCLHESKLVHRDLKLDNCGMDQLQRAKIFDLGSVTSEPGGIEGTIFTRAPELFSRQSSQSLFGGPVPAAQMLPEADIWALGATLFALRSGLYPFVYDNEISARRALNSKIGQNKIDHKEALLAKRELDEAISARIFKKNSLKNLSEQVKSNLRGRAGEILSSMLSGDPVRRLTAREYAEEWSQLSNHLGGAGPLPEHRGDQWEQILKQLRAVDGREFTLTGKQIERLISEVAGAQKTEVNGLQLEEIDKLLRRIKSKSNLGGALRPAR
jgi:serine/threonine protein kinase